MEKLQQSQQASYQNKLINTIVCKQGPEEIFTKKSVSYRERISKDQEIEFQCIFIQNGNMYLISDVIYTNPKVIEKKLNPYYEEQISFINGQIYQLLKKKLTFQEQVYGTKIVNNYSIYQEQTRTQQPNNQQLNVICIPRAFGEAFFQTSTNPFFANMQIINDFSIPEENEAPRWKKMKFQFPLRPVQQRIKDETFEIIEARQKTSPWTAIILNLHVGFGKTILMLNIAHSLSLKGAGGTGVKTLIVVNKSVLLQQWKDQFSNCFNCDSKEITNYIIENSSSDEQLKKGRKGGTKGTKKESIHHWKNEVYFGIVNSLIKLPASFFRQFQCVIIDEVHFVPTKTFIQVIKNIQHAQYVFGLSATSERDDKKHEIYQKFFDYKLQHDLDYKGTIDLQLFGFRDSNDSFYNQKITNQMKKNNKQLFVQSLSTIFINDSRNELICDIIEETVRKEPERKILLISSRINHIDLLYEMLRNRKVDVGRIYQKVRETENQVILGMIKIVQEGLDIPALNTLFIATPEGSNINKQKQIVGRILRKTQTVNPLYIDIFDYPLSYKNKKRYDGYNQIFNNIFFTTKEVSTQKIEKTFMDKFSSEQSAAREQQKKSTPEMSIIDQHPNNFYSYFCLQKEFVF